MRTPLPIRTLLIKCTIVIAHAEFILHSRLTIPSMLHSQETASALLTASASLLIMINSFGETLVLGGYESCIMLSVHNKGLYTHTHAHMYRHVYNMYVRGVCMFVIHTDMFVHVYDCKVYTSRPHIYLRDLREPEGQISRLGARF